MELHQSLVSSGSQRSPNTFTVNRLANTTSSSACPNVISCQSHRLVAHKSGFQPNYAFARELSLLIPVYSANMHIRRSQSRASNRGSSVSAYWAQSDSPDPHNLETESPVTTSGYMKSMNFSLVGGLSFEVGFGAKSQYRQARTDFSHSQSSGYKQVLPRVS